ncbi:MAG: hypothetical protein ABW116_13505 [Candidatus Sedimenticola sp. 20ELBAFRAG]
MRLPRKSPLSDKTIRHFAASSCLVDAAIAAEGIWSPSALENKVFGRGYSQQKGTFKRMIKGIVPNDATANRISKALNNRCDIKKWRDHPFWPLLLKRSVSDRETQAALLSIGEEVWPYVWNEFRPAYLADCPYSRQAFTMKRIDAIAEIKTMDALFSLIALGRQVREIGLEDEYIWAKYKSELMFADVIGKTPHLYICWKALAARIRTVFWDYKGVKSPSNTQMIGTNEMEAQIEQAVKSANNKGLLFPPRTLLDRQNRIVGNSSHL